MRSGSEECRRVGKVVILGGVGTSSSTLLVALSKKSKMTENDLKLLTHLCTYIIACNHWHIGIFGGPDHLMIYKYY